MQKIRKCYKITGIAVYYSHILHFTYEIRRYIGFILDGISENMRLGEIYSLLNCRCNNAYRKEYAVADKKVQKAGFASRLLPHGQGAIPLFSGAHSLLCSN